MSNPMNRTGLLDGNFREVFGPCWIDLVNSSRNSVTVTIQINGKGFRRRIDKFSMASLSVAANEKAELKAAGRTVTYEVRGGDA